MTRLGWGVGPELLGCCAVCATRYRNDKPTPLVRATWDAEEATDYGRHQFGAPPWVFVLARVRRPFRPEVLFGDEWRTSPRYQRQLQNNRGTLMDRTFGYGRTGRAVVQKRQPLPWRSLVASTGALRITEREEWPDGRSVTTVHTRTGGDPEELKALKALDGYSEHVASPDGRSLTAAIEVIPAADLEGLQDAFAADGVIVRGPVRPSDRVELPCRRCGTNRVIKGSTLHRIAERAHMERQPRFLVR